MWFECQRRRILCLYRCRLLCRRHFRALRIVALVDVVVVVVVVVIVVALDLLAWQLAFEAIGVAAGRGVETERRNGLIDGRNECIARSNSNRQCIGLRAQFEITLSRSKPTTLKRLHLDAVQTYSHIIDAKSRRKKH